jgi:hypothetical protein
LADNQPDDSFHGSAVRGTDAVANPPADDHTDAGTDAGAVPTADKYAHYSTTKFTAHSQANERTDRVALPRFPSAMRDMGQQRLLQRPRWFRFLALSAFVRRVQANNHDNHQHELNDHPYHLCYIGDCW